MSADINIDTLIDAARGATDFEPADVENRNTRRVEYRAQVAFVQWTPTGGKSIATVVDCRNISSSGICVSSRYMLHVGHQGAVLMARSDGEEVMLGVKVVHCKYVGEMMHESGLAFTAVPEQFTVEDFRDASGHMPDLEKRAA